MTTGADFVVERRAMAATAAELGADAPTLCPGWTVGDLGAHVVSLERMGGLPTYLGRRLLLAGVPVQRFGGAASDLGVRAGRRKGFTWVLTRLHREPPRLLQRRSVAAMSLLEAWVHHEDMRRANGMGPRPDDVDLEPCIAWARSFHRGRLGSTEISGRPGEVLLWLTGRHSFADVVVADGAAPPDELSI